MYSVDTPSAVLRLLDPLFTSFFHASTSGLSPAFCFALKYVWWILRFCLALHSKITSEIIDSVYTKAGINFTQLETAIKALELVETSASAPRPNDLYRDIIRRIVTILEAEMVPN